MFLQLLLAAAVQTAPQPPAPAAAQVTPPAPPALPSEDLGAVRGGDGTTITLTEQALSAVNASSVQANVVGSGAIAVSTGAFANFDGVGNFVMNTGHANTIQSSLSVTVTMSPAPIP